MCASGLRAAILKFRREISYCYTAMCWQVYVPLSKLSENRIIIRYFQHFGETYRSTEFYVKFHPSIDFRQPYGIYGKGQGKQFSIIL
jgi:hypothetical protein